MLILALVSSRDLVKDIPPISVVIMGAPGSLFFIGKEFITMELTKLDPFGISMGSTYTFQKFSIGRDMLDGIYQRNGCGHLFKGV